MKKPLHPFAWACALRLWTAREDDYRKKYNEAWGVVSDLHMSFLLDKGQRRIRDLGHNMRKEPAWTNRALSECFSSARYHKI